LPAALLRRAIPREAQVLSDLDRLHDPTLVGSPLTAAFRSRSARAATCGWKQSGRRDPNTQETHLSQRGFASDSPRRVSRASSAPKTSLYSTAAIETITMATRDAIGDGRGKRSRR
jgi:hypothetical protein